MKHSRFYQTVVAIAMMLMGWLPSLAHDFEVDGICYNILSDNSVDITVRVWVKASDYWTVHFQTNQAIYTTFNERGISFPYPQIVVHQGEANA